MDEDETIETTYYRLTGRNYDDLPTYLQHRFLLIPPDATLDDITSALDITELEEIPALEVRLN